MSETAAPSTDTGSESIEGDMGAKVESEVNSNVSKKVDGVKGNDGKETGSKERNMANESKGTTGTWSAVVQSNPKMKKYDYTVRDVDGVPTIRVPKEVIKKSTPLWEDMLVGKFQSTAPYVGKIHMLVNKIWPLSNKTVKIDVIVVDKTTVKFRIKDAAIRNRVLRRGMWNICGIPMIISKWSPIEEETLPEVKTMPLWVVVKNVPRYMYTWEGFAFMTSPIGEPIRLHPETEMCKSFEEGRVFVEADLTKPLPTQYNFDTEEGENVLVTFEYPWLPQRCHQCSKWGHNISDCLKKKEVVSGSPTKSPKEVREAGKVTLENSKVTVENSKMAKPVLDEAEHEHNTSPDNANLGSKKKNVTIDPKKGVEGEQEEAWSTPLHSITSPVKVTKGSKYGDVRIEASCFSTLSGKGENGEDIDEEKVEEGEVTDELDCEKRWSYRDPEGNVRGPFSLAQLHKWKDYFPSDLKIWSYYGNVKEFILLQSALKRRTKDVG